MSFLGISSASTRARLKMLDDAVNSTRMNMSANGCGTLGQRGSGGSSAFTPRSISAVVSAWPWQVANTSKGSTGQVQIGGNDFLAALNGKVSTVSGNPTNVQTGSPLAYPQLAVSGNGYIYAKAAPTTAGTATPLASLPITFETSVQAQDTSNPAAYYWMLLATITNYATDGSGNVSFTLSNQFGPEYGPSTLIYCGSDNHINVY